MLKLQKTRKAIPCKGNVTKLVALVTKEKKEYGGCTFDDGALNVLLDCFVTMQATGESANEQNAALQ